MCTIRYRGVVYDHCILKGRPMPWCAVKHGAVAGDDWRLMNGLRIHPKGMLDFFDNPSSSDSYGYCDPDTCAGSIVAERMPPQPATLNPER